VSWCRRVLRALHGRNEGDDCELVPGAGAASSIMGRRRRIVSWCRRVLRAFAWD